METQYNFNAENKLLEKLENVIFLKKINIKKRKSPIYVVYIRLEVDKNKNRFRRKILYLS